MNITVNSHEFSLDVSDTLLQTAVAISSYIKRYRLLSKMAFHSFVIVIVCYDQTVHRFAEISRA
jgi:hypothetical protein